MSVQEIQSLAEQFCEAFNRKDLNAALAMLADDLEVFDTVPYRFDGKEQFAQFLAGAIEGFTTLNFSFRQPSCRVYNDSLGIVNAYDVFVGQAKDGKAVTTYGRTTLVFARVGGQWKIVSAHFSALPQSTP